LINIKHLNNSNIKLLVEDPHYRCWVSCKI